MTTNSPRRSLGARELALLENWEADRIKVVTLADIQGGLGGETSRDATRAMALRLHRKGFLSPIGRGLYEVLPVGTLGVAAPDVSNYLEALRLRRIHFYVGFDTAAGHYGWYPEAYGRVTIGVPRSTRLSRSSMEGTYIRVVQVAPDIFADGVVQENWCGARLTFSTREQTILDVVGKVSLIDGISGCLGVLAEAARDPRINRIKLVELAAERTSVRHRKRLGWLAERAGWTWTEREFDLLARGWPPSHRATLGTSHGRGNAGKWDNRWKLLVNVPERELSPPPGVR